MSFDEVAAAHPDFPPIVIRKMDTALRGVTITKRALERAREDGALYDAAADLGREREADAREAADLLSDLANQWHPDVGSAANPAKRLAEALHGTLPVIYGASPGTEPVARRWKTQLNENSKVHAVYGSFPEIVHNEVVAWDGAGDNVPPRSVVVLRDRDDGPASEGRIEAARSAAFQRARSISDVWSVGSGRLARVFSLILFGDLVSVYLAVLRGVDPTPVAAIDAIKQRLRPG